MGSQIIVWASACLYCLWSLEDVMACMRFANIQGVIHVVLISTSIIITCIICWLIMIGSLKNLLLFSCLRTILNLWWYQSVKFVQWVFLWQKKWLQIKTSRSISSHHYNKIKSKVQHYIYFNLSLSNLTKDSPTICCANVFPLNDI